MITSKVKVGKIATRPVKIQNANAIVQARINKDIKASASHILSAAGLSVSDFVRLILTKVANEHAVPFELLVPNKKTIAAMKELESGKRKKFKSVKALMADLKCD